MRQHASRVVVYIGSFLLFWLIAAPGAHAAYIDPGSSSFIIQILIGAAAGLGLAIATFWRRIRLFFMKNKPATETAPEATPPVTPAPDTQPETGGPDPL
jgi:hypothetical protein